MTNRSGERWQGQNTSWKKVIQSKDNVSNKSSNRRDKFIEENKEVRYEGQQSDKSNRENKTSPDENIKR